MENFFRRIERRADRNRDEVFTRHHGGNRSVDVGLEPQIAVGENSDQPAFFVPAFGNRHARDAVLLHELERFVDAVIGRERNRIDDHAALRSLHAIDFRRLLFNRKVLVDDADAAVLRHGNRQPGFGHGVHRGAGDGHVQLNVSREAAADVDLTRNNGGMAWNQQNVVERQGRRQIRDDVNRAQLKN